ncbi:MAG: two-component regulator propeller domain-containing protein [Cyclobacteriaceae bacterium]
MNLKFYSLLLLCLFINTEGWSQESIPVGTWRLHLSFNDLNILATSPEQIYAANEVGILMYSKNDKEISILSKANGLSGAPVSALAYDEQRNLLLIAFENGLINILSENKISIFSNLANSPAISGSRRINHITLSNKLAYLSTDFGVVVFDLDKREVKETYRDLSDTGESLIINESVIFQDSIYLATEHGVLAGAVTGSTNLLDFRNWKRYTVGPLDNPVTSLTIFNDQVYAAINFQGIFSLQAGAWMQQAYFQSGQFKSISGSPNQLLITTGNQVWSVNAGTVEEIGADSFTNPDQSIIDDWGVIWIADGANGLLTVKDGVISQVKPSGPSSNAIWRVTYSFDRILNSKGGFSSSLQALENVADVDQFVNEQWSVLPSDLSTDITDQGISTRATFISSFGNGLEKITSEGSVIFNESNSPLQKAQPIDKLLIPAIEVSSDDLWIANYGVSPSLHLLSVSSTWESFVISQPQAQFPVDVLIDRTGLIWMIIDPLKGGGIVVFNKNDNRSVYLSSLAGSGGLPSSVVRSIAVDRDGQVWIGTDMGVVFFSNPGNVFNGSVDASRPIFENRFLLRDETVTTIAIDGGNRKWLGTNNGVWLFDSTGEELIYNFTVENSPLLSNKIVSIAIDPHSGEVFFGTDKGLSSFRSTATSSANQFNEVKIFPNPVSAEFSGQVAINGLFTDAIVKITDISGRLIWQTRANGGTAIWNARQVNGDRISTGMYLVFATAEDGTERHVGKIAVIE